MWLTPPPLAHSGSAIVGMCRPICCLIPGFSVCRLTLDLDLKCTSYILPCKPDQFFIHGRVEVKVFSHVTFMPVLLRLVNNFLGQVIGNASEGKYNTVNNSSSGEVTFQKCLNSGITIFSSKYSN